jgi:hypothetical protein
MSNPVTLAVHELEALLEKAKAAAEHIIHPEVPAPVAVAAPVTSTPVAAVPAPKKVVAQRIPAGVKIAGQVYLKDGLTQEWVERKK